MRKAHPLSPVTLALAICILAFLLAQSVMAMADDTVSITDLIDNMKKYDGKEVTIEGEAVGDIMVRGTKAWITVNDDVYSRKSIEEGGELVGMSNVGIGVWLTAREARRIEVLGGYKHRGDRVRLTGVFNRACAEHGGDTDIHASSLEIVSEGYLFSHGFHFEKLISVLALACLVAVLWYRRKRVVKKTLKEE